MAPDGDPWVLAGLLCPQVRGGGEPSPVQERGAWWPFPLLCCKAVLAAVKSFQYVFFCGFEWDRVLSCVWETQWVDRKTLHLTSGVCENLKEL